MKRILLCIIAILALASSGCRRPPANPPLLYEKEARELAEKIKAKKEAEERQYLSDRYPWESKRNSCMEKLPDRLTETHERIKAEMELLRLVIYGPKKGK